MMYKIKSLRTNKTILGKLLPNNAPITVSNLKDFFDKGKFSEKEILERLKKDKEIKLEIKKDKDKK